jgi:hypothetical protein
MSVRVEHRQSPGRHRPGIAILPTTNLGWWAVGLVAAFFPLVFAAGVFPGAAALGFLCGVAGGMAAITAIVRDHERALTVYAGLVPFLIAIAFAVAQLF